MYRLLLRNANFSAGIGDGRGSEVVRLLDELCVDGAQQQRGVGQRRRQQNRAGNVQLEGGCAAGLARCQPCEHAAADDRGGGECGLCTLPRRSPLLGEQRCGCLEKCWHEGICCGGLLAFRELD